MKSVDPVLVIFQNRGAYKLFVTFFADKLRISHLCSSSQKVFVVLVSFKDVIVHCVEGFEFDVTQGTCLVFSCRILKIFELQLSVTIISVILEDIFRNEPFSTMFFFAFKYQVRICQLSFKCCSISFVHIFMRNKISFLGETFVTQLTLKIGFACKSFFGVSLFTMRSQHQGGGEFFSTEVAVQFHMSVPVIFVPIQDLLCDKFLVAVILQAMELKVFLSDFPRQSILVILVGPAAVLP